MRFQLPVTVFEAECFQKLVYGKFTRCGNAGVLHAGRDQSYLVYGVSLDTDLRMPFNRADYYIARPDPMPEGCAPGTGILYKALVSQSNGGLSNALPVIDCVADMQVAFGLDTNSDGGID